MTDTEEPGEAPAEEPAEEPAVKEPAKKKPTKKKPSAPVLVQTPNGTFEYAPSGADTEGH